MADNKGHANSVIEAFNSSDWDSMEGLLGDSSYTEFGTQRTLRGGDIIDAMKGWKGAMPDVTGTVTSVAESGDAVVLEITWTGTHTGPMVTPDGEIPASGKSQTTPGAWIANYENGELKETRHYFDLLTFLQQIGAA